MSHSSLNDLGAVVAAAAVAVVAAAVVDMAVAVAGVHGLAMA